MARAWIYIAVCTSTWRAICRMGCGAAIQYSGHSRDGPEGRAVRRSVKRRAQARAVQIVWQGVHAGASCGGVDGFLGRIMRRVLQLRTPETLVTLDSEVPA